MNEFEKLLSQSSFFEKENIEFKEALTKREESKNKTALPRANGSASLLDFLEMFSLIVNNTMDDMHVECMPDEKAYVIKEDPVEAINHPIVTFKVKDRQHKEKFGYKPKLVESLIDEQTGKTVFIYQERFTSLVQINIMASEYRTAWTIMDRIEDTLLSYAETIKGNGIVEYYFNRQYHDEYYDTFRNTLSVLNLEYCVETEKLRVIFKENIKDIVTNDVDENQNKK